MSFDNDSFLPSSAIARLDVIRARAVAERAVRQGLLDQQRDAVERRQRAQGEVERMARYLKNNHVIAEQAKADDISAATKVSLDAINARIGALPTSATALDGMVAAFLKRLRHPVAAAPAVTFQPKRGESASAAVDRLRAERANLMADLREVKASPITAKEAREIVRQQVETLAAAGEPSVLPVLEAGCEFQFPQGMMDTDRRSISGYLPSVVPFIFWLARDAITERLNNQISDLADDSRALDASERGYREDLLATQILNCERAEAEAIFQADQQGVAIAFRSDANVAAVLGIVEVNDVTD
jgi:hypothetical protein